MAKEFLPEGYKVPKSGGGNYTKLVDGANKLRILSAPIMGWVYWNTAGKPVRSREPFAELPSDVRYKEEKKTGESKPERPKHFWAVVVWSYTDKMLQVWECTQGTIQSQITDLISNPDWGDPREYDITINRKGEGFDTEYTVQPSPAKPLNPMTESDYKKANIRLEALFDGGNPFDPARSDEEIAAAEEAA
jgi:hypothetical protein